MQCVAGIHSLEELSRRGAACIIAYILAGTWLALSNMGLMAVDHSGRE